MNRTQLPAQTLHWHQLDHPSPGPLSQMSDPLPVLREQARSHVCNRLDSVAEMMSLVGILLHQQVLSGREVVSVGAAWFQHGVGSRGDQLQAAHCLPGQLKFDNRPIHTAPDWAAAKLQNSGLKALAMASKLRSLSGRTDPADSSVNQVDSLLEMMSSGRGLKPSFGRATGLLVDTLLHRGANSFDQIADAVGHAFRTYRWDEILACQERLRDLTHDLNRAGDSDAGEKLQRKVVVVEQYLEVSQTGSFIPRSATSSGFYSIVQDVVSTTAVAST